MCHWKWQYAFTASCRSCFLKKKNLLSYLGLLQSVYVSNSVFCYHVSPGWCWLKLAVIGSLKVEREPRRTVVQLLSESRIHTEFEML